MEKRFADKTVFVTGASGGIGAAICQQFEDEGAKVIGVGRSVPKIGDSTAKAVILSDSDAVNAAAEASREAFGYD